MDRNLHLHPLIQNDIESALDWYDHISARLMQRFRSAVSQTLREIERQPLLFAHVFRGQPMRFGKTERFPYLIPFYVENDTIWILGVFHSASDPSRWKERLDDIESF